MVLIMSDMNLDEIKSVDLYKYIEQSKGFFDFTKGRKNSILERVNHIPNWYRFYRNVPLNIIIISDKEWESFCDDRLKNSVHISCWVEVPEYLDLSKRLDDVTKTEEDVQNLVDQVKAVNFRDANLNVQLKF